MLRLHGRRRPKLPRPRHLVLGTLDAAQAEGMADRWFSRGGHNLIVHPSHALFIGDPVPTTGVPAFPAARLLPGAKPKVLGPMETFAPAAGEPAWVVRENVLRRAPEIAAYRRGPDDLLRFWRTEVGNHAIPWPVGPIATVSAPLRRCRGIGFLAGPDRGPGSLAGPDLVLLRRTELGRHATTPPTGRGGCCGRVGGCASSDLGTSARSGSGTEMPAKRRVFVKNVPRKHFLSYFSVLGARRVERLLPLC